MRREPGDPVPMTPVALYIRAAEGDPDNTLQIQLERLGAYVRRIDLEQVRAYFDVLGSRTQFDGMMAEATSGRPPFRRILVVNCRRFAADPEQFRRWTDRLEEHGVSVVSITESPGGD